MFLGMCSLRDSHLWTTEDLPGSRAAGSVQTSGEPVLQSEVEGRQLPEPCLPGTSVVCLHEDLRLRGRTAHIREGDLLYPRSTDLKVNPIQKTPSDTSGIGLDPVLGPAL